MWPETAVGYLEGELYRRHRERVQAMVDSLGIYLYTGAYRLEAGEPVKVFNSSFLFVPGKGISGYYDKTRLVPFGERAPFPEILPFLAKNPVHRRRIRGWELGFRRDPHGLQRPRRAIFRVDLLRFGLSGIRQVIRGSGR